MAKMAKLIAILGLVTSVAACSSGTSDDTVVIDPITPEMPTGKYS